MRDITDTKRTHERLLQDAVNCPVTKLPNREIFIDRLAVASQRAKTEDTIRPTVIFIDIDRFRSVNKNLGPHRGSFDIEGAALSYSPLLQVNAVSLRIQGEGGGQYDKQAEERKKQERARAFGHVPHSTLN